MPESEAQKQIVARVMHEAKHGELKTAGGRTVRNPKQAIAIALQEAGASREQDAATQRRTLAGTRHANTRGRPGRKRRRVRARRSIPTPVGVTSPGVRA